MKLISRKMEWRFSKMQLETKTYETRLKRKNRMTISVTEYRLFLFYIELLLVVTIELQCN